MQNLIRRRRGHLTLFWRFNRRYTLAKRFFLRALHCLREEVFLVCTVLFMCKGATEMATSDNARAPADRQVLGMILLSLGLYAIVLGWTVPLALLSWPGAMENDSSFEVLLLAVVLFVGGSLLILASLLCLRVHWLLVIAVLLLALLTPYGEGRLFPTDPASWATTWFLTYGAVVVVLSLLLLGRRKGVWPALWRTLLVTGASAAMVTAVAYGCAQVAAAGPGPTNGNPPAGNPVYPFASVVVGSLALLLVVSWLRRRERGSRLSD
jgi:hypothetical protein